MKNFKLSLSLTLSASLFLVACGPEANSRYGDKHWDPMDTWDKASVVAQPSLTVEYRDNDPNDNDDVEDWEAYVSLDFTEISKISTNLVTISYSSGTSSDLSIDDFLQINSKHTDTRFYYNTDTSTDYRLHIDAPGIYNLDLELQAAQPNGTIRNYDFSYENITVPGWLPSYKYYTYNVNSIIGDYCLACHRADGSDARAAFYLPDDPDNRRDNLLEKIDNPTLGNEILNYPFEIDVHTGASVAITMSSVEKSYFQNYIKLLLSAKGDGKNIRTDIDLQEIAKPSIMENDQWQ